MFKKGANALVSTQKPSIYSNKDLGVCKLTNVHCPMPEASTISSKYSASSSATLLQSSSKPTTVSKTLSYSSYSKSSSMISSTVNVEYVSVSQSGTSSTTSTSTTPGQSGSSFEYVSPVSTSTALPTCSKSYLNSATDDVIVEHNNVPIYVEQEPVNITVSAPEAQENLSYDQCREACEKAISAKDCNKVVNQTIYIENCINDVWAIKDISLVETSRSAFASECSKMILKSGIDVTMVQEKLGFYESECPNKCSGNGECRSYGCVCKPGFTGFDCGTCIAKSSTSSILVTAKTTTNIATNYPTSHVTLTSKSKHVYDASSTKQIEPIKTKGYYSTAIVVSDNYDHPSTAQPSVIAEEKDVTYKLHSSSLRFAASSISIYALVYVFI
jgi:hypothetical protein